MTTPLLQCPSCSAAISVESRFCSSCGREVDAFSQMPTAPPRASPAVPQLARHISSDSIPAGGFTPGTILTDRYRIIGLLGRGGMGEVYRADDLKLGQPVALKFLPKALGSDPVRRERFFAEVRITRQLAHPNICRVYDIAEVDGQHFLSMEYIDGEDLASLIKRIGHLSNEKALDIARQLAAGLAAAHAKGVLHRDLKPANVMLDGHGRVRITDFGLAIAEAEEETEAGEILGTPAYMAPEQFAGKGATTRSDIYGFGLILYEIYCGKRAFTSGSIAELRAQKEQQTPRAPSEIRQGIDPVVERLIQRCLERDPRARPPSVSQLALALPGGDPLAAALAAGETPSPEMVAASGLKEGLRPAAALGIVAWLIVGSVAGILLQERSPQHQAIKTAKPPAILEQRAGGFLSRAGYTDSLSDSASGFDTQADLDRYLQTNQPATLGSRSTVFWRRLSPVPLGPAGIAGASLNNPTMQLPGEIAIAFDIEGRLIFMRAIPPRIESSAGAAAPADWRGLLLTEAGLDASRWTRVDPQRIPPDFADERTAWQGVLPELPEIPVRIEAAAHHGKPVSFEIIGPWTQATDVDQGPPLASVIVLGAFFGGVLLLVRRNLRLGRGDRLGARRLALFAFSTTAVGWAFRTPHILTLDPNYIALALFISSGIWCFYIALEPLVRRRWPAVLVSWMRLLAGEWRDPMLGRDVLIGCSFGVAMYCVDVFVPFLRDPQWSGPAAQLLHTMGVARFAAEISRAVGGGTFWALGFLCFLSLLRLLLRNDKLLIAATVLILPVLIAMNGFSAGIRTAAVYGLASLAIVALSVFALMRFGLVALAAAWFVDQVLNAYPMTLQSSLWYSRTSYAALAVVAAVAFYGFRTALAGRPILDSLVAEE